MIRIREIRIREIRIREIRIGSKGTRREEIGISGSRTAMNSTAFLKRNPENGRFDFSIAKEA